MKCCSWRILNGNDFVLWEQFEMVSERQASLYSWRS